MATWAFLDALSVSRSVRQPAIDSNKLYFINNLYGTYIDTGTTYGQVYEYNPATSTQTLIYDPTTHTDHYATWSLCAFAGDLYIAVELDHGATIEGTVLKYTGTPDSWTQVYTTGTSNVADGYIRLYASDTEIVYLGRIFSSVGSFANVARSTDGSSWSAGSISPLPVEPGNGWSGEFDDTVYWPLGFYDFFCNSVSGSNCSNSDVYSQSAGTWGVFQASPAVFLVQSSPVGSIHFGDSGEDVMPLDMSTSSTPDPNIGALYLLNAMAFVVGVDPQASSTLVYKYSGGAWVSLETMSTSMAIDPVFSSVGGWIANGSTEAWLLGFNNSSSDWEVWERSEPFETLGDAYSFTRNAGGIPGAVMV